MEVLVFVQILGFRAEELVWVYKREESCLGREGATQTAAR